MMDYASVGDPRLGIRLYGGSLRTSRPIVETIETYVGRQKNSTLIWSKALVGYQQEMPDHRNCWDCKLTPQAVESLPLDYEEFKTAYSEVVMSVAGCVEDYTRNYGIEMTYMEAVNFVKYGVGEHFGAHSDHGFSYVCTVSTVAFLNDGYEGGELRFDRLEQTIVPRTGDIVVFPSAFVYSHASLPVRSGVKYSAVTMFDYSDAAHKAGGFPY